MRSWEQTRAERTLWSQKTGFLLLTLRSTLFCCVTLNRLLLPAEWRGTLPSRSLLVIRFFDKWMWWALQSSTHLSDVYTAQLYSHSLSHVLFQLFLGYAEALPSHVIPTFFHFTGHLLSCWSHFWRVRAHAPVLWCLPQWFQSFRFSIKAFDPLELFLE